MKTLLCRYRCLVTFTCDLHHLWRVAPRILRTESEALKAELEMVFGKGLQYAVEEEVAAPTSDAAVIALAVLLTISMLALMLIVVLSVLK